MYTSKTSAVEKTYIKSYSGFGGVDFSSAVTEVADHRSPDAQNMIGDFDKFPQKRCGYETVSTGLDGRVNGIFRYVNDTSEMMIVHAGGKLYAYGGGLPEGTPTEIFTAAKNDRSTSFVMDKKIYILDGANYIEYDGTEAKRVVGYVPTTVVAAAPDGGGTDYEPINLISPQRINSFLGTAAATEYQLDAADITSVDKCERLTSSGTWEELSAYTKNLQTGVVTFSTPPGVSPVTGEDNVRIMFSKQSADNENKIRKCSVYASYGAGNDNRIFVSGNDDYRNYDWCSRMNDPTYFPDTQYSIIGTDVSAIMGYLKQYSELIIVKESNDQDATLFTRSVSEDNDGNTIFPVIQGLAGVGAVSKHCFGTLYDDNVFLTTDGVFGFDTSKTTLQKTTQNRSYFVNAKLTKEESLQEAVCCVWKGFYCVFINNHVYLADSKQRTANRTDSFGYEWYYWTNVPARCAAQYRGRLYFGTTDGKLCVFKDEKTVLMNAYSDDGAAIDAYWTTKMDALGDPSRTKTVKKRNVGIIAMPFARSSAKIYYLKNESDTLAKEYSLSSVFDFDDIDFDDINFGLSPVPYFVPTNKKCKKCKMFRIKVQNNTVNEAFGLYGVYLEYEIGNAIKRPTQ